MATTAPKERKWIAIAPNEGIHLKAISEDDHFILVIDGLSPEHHLYKSSRFKLGFTPVEGTNMLARRLPRNLVKASLFHAVWPRAKLVPVSELSKENYLLTPEQREQVRLKYEDKPAAQVVASTPANALTKAPEHKAAKDDRRYANWIDLKDPDGIMLKAGRYNERLTLVLEGITPGSQLFHRVVNELSFIPSKEGVYLMKTHPKGKLAYPSEFHSIWPKAGLSRMLKSDFSINFDERIKRLEKAKLSNKDDAAQARDDQRESLHAALTQSTYLGRNHEGNRVYSGVVGRFFVTDDDRLTVEDEIDSRTLFMRSNTMSEIRDCVKGLLIACEKGESYRIEQLISFTATVLDKAANEVTVEDREIIARTIDSVILETLQDGIDTVGQAGADAAYFQEMMPGRAQFCEDSSDIPFVPAPVATQIQRYLEPFDTVQVSGRIPSIGFGLLPDSTRVFVEDPETLQWGEQSYHRPSIEPLHQMQSAPKAGYLRISGETQEDEIEQFFMGLDDTATAVVTAGSNEIQSMLGRHANILQAIKVPSFLATTNKPIFMYVVQKGEAPAESFTERKPSTITSWDDLKSIVDETLLSMGRQEEATENVKPRQNRADNRFQRPYIAFSRTGQSSTMVPKNLQSALSFALSRLDETYGGVDQFVADEMGMSIAALGEKLSPEQVDAIALILHRLQQGRGFILGDETGIGKGRTIGSVCAWGNKQERKIIFVTDRANLFSDLVRDLQDIGEWERFRPLITNSDGQIMNIMGDGGTLVDALTAAQFNDVLKNGHNSNLIFTTYSQMNQTDSVKAKWLIEQAKDALVICDEAHVGAGSDSNVAQNLEQLLEEAWGVVYSSATWAKSSKNLRVYQRALPESVNVAQVSSAMEEEGESFSEVFSSMLAMDGAFIRREHDLSKIDFVLDTADKYAERNIEITDKVAEVLGMMAMLSGDINSMLQRMNSATRNALIDAKDAHSEIRRADTENTQRLLQQRDRLEQELLARQVDLAALRSEQQASPENEQNQEALVNALNDIASIERDLEGLPKNPKKTLAKPRMFTSSFGTGGAIYQVMRRTQSALLADHVGDRILAGLEKGQRPVVVFAETGENFVRQFIEDEHDRIREEVKSIRSKVSDGEQVDADTLAQTKELAALLDAGARSTDVVKQIRVPTIPDMMRGLLQRLGGIRVSELDIELEENPENEDGARNAPRIIEHQQLVASDNLINLPGLNPADIGKYMEGINAITAKIDTLPKVPIIPIDALRARLSKEGVSVSEISGRNYQLDPVNNTGDITDGPVRIVKRAKKKTDVIAATKSFNDGHSDVIAINESGATGISVHASPRFGNSNQRLIIEWQPSADSQKRSQLFGRGNRFDQVVPPEIAMQSSGVPSENRAIMMNNKKFAGMSATIRSSRENAVINESIPDLLNKTGDRVVQEYLLDNPGIASRLDIPIDRVKTPYGLANMITQRLSLLESRHYLKVFEDLTAAYEDALIENELSKDSDTIVTQDWKAKTVRQKRVWGPAENIDRLSAFDSPVYHREVQYQRFYNPLHWNEVTQRIAASTSRLLEDGRVKVASARVILPRHQGEFVFNHEVSREAALTKEAQELLWADKVLQAMARFLPDEAVTGDVDDDPASRFAAQQEDSEEDAPATPLARNKRVPLGFKSLADHWLPLGVRAPGAEQTQCMMALISRSGQSAKLWVLDEMGGAKHYYINLNKAIENFDGNVAQAFHEIASVELNEGSWQRKRFDAVWGSTNPQIKVIDFSAAIKKAGVYMEAKKITALSSTSFDSVDAALAHPGHNAIKEAHQRKYFIDQVLPRLTPGAQIWVNADASKNKRFSWFFKGKRMIIADVVLPKENEESVLSKWKFHVVSAGDEKPTVMSGALIFKMAGHAPLFKEISVEGNVFAGYNSYDHNSVARSFDCHKKETLTLRKNLLVGNAFQAGEWARNTKRGEPIIYTDQNGNPHRAIEINNDARSAVIDAASFPMQLRQSSMINRLLDEIFVRHAQGEIGAQRAPGSMEQINGLLMHSSFSGALALSSFTKGQPDQVIIDPENNAISLLLDKNEKEKFRRSLRAAVNAEKSRWQHANPGEQDLLEYKTKAARTSKEQRQTVMAIALPVDVPARHRFIRSLVESQGFSLFISRIHSQDIYDLASSVEQEYYQNSISEADAQQQARQEQNKNRLARRQMLDNAIEPLAVKLSPPEAKADAPSSHQELEESTRAPSVARGTVQTQSAQGDHSTTPSEPETLGQEQEELNSCNAPYP